MNFINNFIPEELTRAIGWTIFHSIWQGIIVAILLATILLLTGKKSARLRYNISVAALFIMSLLSVSTFIKYYEAPKISSADELVLVSAGTENIPSKSLNYTPVFEQPNFDLPDFFKTYFTNHLSFIVSAWVIGFLFFSFRFAGGLLYIQRLRFTGLSDIDGYWSNRLKEFAAKVKIDRLVHVYESARVRVPIAIGHLKPIILLPIGMLSGLPGDQVEAILIHELAHIKRYDFLVNLFQSFIETLFFYHPVVWWISSAINSERENCCDDIAVQICGDPLSYSKALYNLQQIKSNESVLALAIIGKKNKLYRRIKRMNTKNNKTSYGIRFAAFALLLAAMAIVSIYSTSSAKNETRNLASTGFVNPFSTVSQNVSLESPSGEPFASPDTTSLKKGKRTVKFYEDENGQSKKYKAKLNDGKLEELYIDGEKVADKDLSQYEDKVSKKTDEYESLRKEYRENMKDFRKKMKTYREKMRNLGFKYNHDFHFDFDFPPFPYEDFDGGVFDYSLQKELTEKLQKKLQENLSDISVNIPPIHIPKICVPKIDIDELREELGKCKFDTAAFRESMKELKENMKNFKVNMKEFKEQMKKSGPGSEAFKKSMHELKQNVGKLKEELKPLKEFWRETRDELVKDNLIEPGEDIDGFKLSKEEMIVDGKKVSPELHKKYLEIYKKHYGKELTDDHKIDIEN